ncbi:class I SAM-dependent methyltransferase [Roseixanthobacter pseudopolyaromaticivorans]|uniref:class I SAM-dependent methyltransferase n=1 Tax=Xanthobacteraceae TaxID=335928 RepID=UPI003728F05B
MTIRPTGNALGLLERWLDPVAGLKVLDVGCGTGALARALSARGAEVTGIDPQADAIAVARQTVPKARFEQAGAQDLPFADAAFGAAVFLNSLHHVPQAVMAAALREAARVSGGNVVVIEPLAAGTFFLSMLPVEDETEIRAQAQAALDAVERDGLRIIECVEYDDPRKFSGLDAFIAKLVEVDPARAPTTVAKRGELDALFRTNAVPEGEGFRLVQPHRAHRLGFAAP